MADTGKIIRKTFAVIISGALAGAVAGGALILADREPEGSSIRAEEIDEMDTIIADKTPEADIDNIAEDTQKTSYTDVSAVVENAMPAVVAINCTVEETYNIFGREYVEEETGSGSGIIIGQNASEILIVTNNHVIEGATKVEIVFSDNSTAEAVVKGAESSSDIAVVSVQASGLSDETLRTIRVASLGDSENSNEGELVIAIGNALGYGQSVTVGYISATDREVEVDDITLNLIQTDAAINPGNSGGALINAYGQVIGINSVKYASMDVEGIGYAIPITEVIPIINDLMNREELAESEMGYIGISGKDVGEDYSTAFNMPVGIYVSKIEEDSPAEEAGLIKGDIITAVNGKTIETMSDLQKFLSYTRGGTQVEFTVMVLEAGQYVEKKINVTLGYKGDVAEDKNDLVKKRR